jgi:chromosome segregation ATPase|tara:strand:+ start:39 stop:356 length:318 start_codon:yes stop_codon:yes gene_type:complete
MSDRDLVQELKSNIVDLTQDRDDALDKVKTKEARLKQVMIKLEHATSDVKHTGHKIEDQNKEIASLQAKVETKDRLLQDALKKIKDIYDDSTKEKESEKEISEEE